MNVNRIELTDQEGDEAVVFIREDDGTWRRSQYKNWSSNAKQELVTRKKGLSTATVVGEIAGHYITK